MFVSISKKTFSERLTTLCAALVTAAFSVIACASFANLIFAGSIQEYVTQGIWIGLFTAFVVGIIVAVGSSYAGAVAIPQDRVAPILGLMAANMGARMTSASPQEKCLAVMTAIAGVSLITGLFLFLLGRLRLGNLIRYIPYPVIGGFLAGSGWLLVKGALRVMTGITLTMQELPAFARPEVVIHWLPGLLFGALLFFSFRRLRHPLTLPVLLIGAILLFWLGELSTGGSIASARQNGWLVDLPPSKGVAVGSALTIFKLAPWHLLGQQWSILATILLTSVVSILLTASALELAADEEIDLNRELRAAGIATFVAGLGGGMVGFHSLSLSRLVISLGARTRWVGIGSGCLCGAALLLGPRTITLVPQFVCGGLLLFLGLTFLWEWVCEARKTLGTVDYAVVILILGVVGAVGYPEGVGVGIISAIIMFIHNYSRVNVVTHAQSGLDLQSNVDRSVREMRALREHGSRIYVLRLQGFIFFGTANHLLAEVRQRRNDATLGLLSFVILDFRRITGLDASAIFSLSKVCHLARKQKFRVIMTDVAPEILLQFERGGLAATEDGVLRVLPDLDRGLEWCEEQLLSEVDVRGNGHTGHLQEQLTEAWPEGIEAHHLLPYLDRLEVPAATYLIRQSEQSECLYFVESGRVTARLEFEGGRTLRLRTMGPGTVVGEVGLFLRGTRAASVVTEQQCTVYRLSASALDRMNRDHPELGLAFHRYVICLLGERLASRTTLLRGMIE